MPTKPSPTGMSTARPRGDTMRAEAISATSRERGTSKSTRSCGGTAPPHGFTRPALSSSSTVRPRLASSCAAVAPEGPPPITTAS
jgi:hypothetical protein